jgi:hypothetical protein
MKKEDNLFPIPHLLVLSYVYKTAKVSYNPVRDPDTRFSTSVFFIKQLPLGP